MMSVTFLVGAIAVLVVGCILLAISKKTREDNGEWSNLLQWGYLLILVGAFGLLSFKLSFTAVLLIFVLFSGVLWLLHKKRVKQSEYVRDDHHLSDYMSGFFPVILVVFLLRSFVAEPFQIPSSSMRPGLIVGDFILVNKFSYGIRLPIVNSTLIDIGQIQRGDVVVFNYPVNPSVNYIKRAIGLPGDTVRYHNKELSINGIKVNDDKSSQAYSYKESIPGYGSFDVSAHVVKENIENEEGVRSFNTLVLPDQPSVVMSVFDKDPEIATYLRNYPYRDQCEYDADGSGFTCRVPEGQYFMMGDNRDNSQDSRYWGFVDHQLIVGKAFLVWLNFSDFSRIGTKIQ